jgi:hypothetical protein
VHFVQMSAAASAAVVHEHYEIKNGAAPFSALTVLPDAEVSACHHCAALRRFEACQTVHQNLLCVRKEPVGWLLDLSFACLMLRCSAAANSIDLLALQLVRQISADSIVW